LRFSHKIKKIFSTEIIIVLVPHIFYGLDALPVAQPTVPKHWRQLVHSD